MIEHAKKPHTFSLIILCAFAALGAVLIAPAIPNIAKSLAVSPAKAQYTISMFLVGYAIGQLLYGPIANRFGRKKAYVLGIILASIGSVCSILSDPSKSFSLLLSGRLLESLGMSSGLVVSFTIIGDYYDISEARKMISYLVISSAAVPAIATAIGGQLVTYFNWTSCFYFLLIYGVALLIPVSRLPETIKKIDPQALLPKKIIFNYLPQLKLPHLVICSFGTGMVTMCIYIFASEAPLIGINILHLSPSTYGLVSMIPYIGMLLGCIASIKLASNPNIHKMLGIAYLIQINGAVIMLLCFAIGKITLTILLGCTFLFMLGGSFIIANLSAIAGAISDDKANASAVLQWINIGMTAVGTFILASISSKSPLILPIFFIVSIIINAGIYVLHGFYYKDNSPV